MRLSIVEEREIRERMTTARAVEAIRAAFRADRERRTRVPAVINLEVPAARGEFHVKTAYIEGVPHIAVKVASGFYDNPAKGLPSGSGLMAVFDAATGLPAALLLDNGYLTDLRTGAAGAVAAEALAPAKIRTAGVIGSGVQARHQIRCLRVVRDFERVIAWSPTRARLEAYCDEMREEGCDASACDGPEPVCRDADVLITATPSRTPLVRAEWLRPGQHVTAVGSDSPGKQELAAACFARAGLIVADRLSQCAAFGELKHAIDAGIVRVDANGSFRLKAEATHASGDVVELGAIVAGRVPGRTRDDQITIADLTGVGFQDTAIASALIESLIPDP